MKNLFVFRWPLNLKHFLLTFLSFALLISILSCTKEEEDCCSTCIDFENISLESIDRNHEIYKQFATTEMFKIINEIIFDKEHEINLISLEKNPFKTFSISIINPTENNIEAYQIMYDTNNQIFIAEGWWLTEKIIKSGSYNVTNVIKAQSILDPNGYIEISTNNLDMTSSLIFSGNSLQEWEDRWDRCMRRRFEEIGNNWVSLAFCLSNPGLCVLQVSAECAWEVSKS